MTAHEGEVECVDGELSSMRVLPIHLCGQQSTTFSEADQEEEDEASDSPTGSK
jgi:hypothetical protein